MTQSKLVREIKKKILSKGLIFSCYSNLKVGGFCFDSKCCFSICKYIVFLEIRNSYHTHNLFINVPLLFNTIFNEIFSLGRSGYFFFPDITQIDSADMMTISHLWNSAFFFSLLFIVIFGERNVLNTYSCGTFVF